MHKFQAKAELDRFLHYYQRYHNHNQAKMFAERLKISTEARMLQLQVIFSSLNKYLPLVWDSDARPCFLERSSVSQGLSRSSVRGIVHHAEQK